MKSQNVALVTGTSSGIGFETSLMLARNGFYTYASMRNLDKSKDITQIARTSEQIFKRILPVGTHLVE